MNVQGAQWHGGILILQYTSLKMALLLHKTVHVNFPLATTVVMDMFSLASIVFQIFWLCDAQCPLCIDMSCVCLCIDMGCEQSIAAHHWFWHKVILFWHSTELSKSGNGKKKVSIRSTNEQWQQQYPYVLYSKRRIRVHNLSIVFQHLLSYLLNN